MKQIDFLKAADPSTPLTASTEVHGMQFETGHTADFFLGHGDGLNSRQIARVCAINRGINARLKNP